VFLGRKNPKKDPPLVGRADYVCDVFAAGQWVVEVKAPHEELDQSVVQQAHTYAAHPEIAAFYFLVTNGQSFRLFQASSLQQPILEWTFDQNDEIFLKLSNVLSPDAIRNRARLVLVDPGLPLGERLASRLRIIGGSVSYDQQIGTHPLMMGMSIAGLQLPVTGGSVYREPDGRIHAELNIAKAAPLLQSLGRGGLADHYDFFSSSSHLSRDFEKPTIFQGFTHDSFPVGGLPFGGPSVSMPLIGFSALTEVVGATEGDTFRGTMTITTEITVSNMNPAIAMVLSQRFGPIPERAKITQVGGFSVSLMSGL